MNILQKIKACITAKMVKNNVPESIAKNCASNFVNNEITAVEFDEIQNKRMKLEYSNLSINRVNTEATVNKARLLSLT